MRKINKIKLFVNDNEKSILVAKDLEQKLKSYDFQIVNNNYDLGISVGGDGSFLRMVKESNFSDKCYYIGVNSGTLGFLQEIDIDKCIDFVKRLNANLYKEEKISIQETKVVTDSKVYKFNSLNEIVIRNNDLSTIKFPVFIDGELFENFSGDGLLISTSTGSTAYNMSFGGSIVYNTLRTLAITPIAPLNNKVYNTLPNSIIVPSDKKITLKLNDSFNNILIIVDGVNHNLNKVNKIDIQIRKKYIKCLRMNEFHFIKVVNSKILDK